jgi:DNA-binding response OmpR family regulator/KaiC/GvpD/RAD55 family RecA-like ATPase
MGENGTNEDPTQKAMEYAAKSQFLTADESAVPPVQIMGGESPQLPGLASGIVPLDERIGGLDPGGVYLFAGTPNPAKLVAALQFLWSGESGGDRSFFLTSSDADSILNVARAWGSDLGPAWKDGRLEILGFREDFEMRALRSADPNDVLEELDLIVSQDVARIAVDPGSMFLQGGARNLLGRSFLEWARRHPATVCITLSIDTAESLPSAAEWLVHSTDGVFLVDRRADGLYQVRINRALPGSPGEEDPITLQLTPGVGLVASERAPSRRRSDRPAGDSQKLLLISLGDDRFDDLESWARGSFTVEVVTDPLEAVANLQAEASFGSILINAPRQELRQAVQACRALRPLTGAAIVFLTDDAIRSTDRVRILEAGADDCLSGGVDFRELEARIRQAVASGGKLASAMEVVGSASGIPSGGRVSPEALAMEANRRAGDSKLSVFSMVRLTSTLVQAKDLEMLLSEEIRDEDGDLITCTGDGCVVLLQGARWDPTQAFLARFQSGLEKRVGHDPALKTETLTYPAEKAEIQSLLEGLGELRREQPSVGGPEGADGPEA